MPPPTPTVFSYPTHNPYGAIFFIFCFFVCHSEIRRERAAYKNIQILLGQGLLVICDAYVCDYLYILNKLKEMYNIVGIV